MIKQTTILVVDDDTDILQALDILLSGEGYRVVTEDKGENVKLLNGRTEDIPDIILLDVYIPDKDGHYIAKELKKNKLTETIPIIMISAHPDAEASAKELGADDFLAKPFDVLILLEKIKKLLNR
jgi:DNA-binding response OmpR family regulator